MVLSRVLSMVSMLLTPLIARLITTHEPPSKYTYKPFKAPAYSYP